MVKANILISILFNYAPKYHHLVYANALNQVS